MNNKIIAITIVFYVNFCATILAQVTPQGVGGSDNPITTAVPFLIFAPDSRGSGMGDAGVATSGDGYSIHWNNAKLARVKKDMGFTLSYSPWLRNLNIDDMALGYLTFYKRIDKLQTVGASLRYFDLGEIQLTDISGNLLGIENPRELGVDAAYSRLLSERFSMGITFRFIWSNIAGHFTGAPNVNAGTSFSVDIGGLYVLPLTIAGREAEMSFGFHISNIGQKITYTQEEFEDFLPGNIRIGTAFLTNLDLYNSLTFALDFNKLLVPTPDPQQAIQPNTPLFSGIFGSFNDAPDGFSEEMKEINISVGLEYWYRDIFAVRAGYFHEHKNKGNRKYFTAGIGFRYRIFGLDFSYLIPPQQNHPLGNTLRLSLTFDLEKKEKGAQNITP